MDNDLDIDCSTCSLPLDYKLLEWRLIINKELYEEKIIDLDVFSEMEKNILNKMNKIKDTD